MGLLLDNIEDIFECVVSSIPGEQPYVCEVVSCNRRFSHVDALRKHQLLHTGEHPYRCVNCGEGFNQVGFRVQIYKWFIIN